MSKITQYSRISHHTLTTTGATNFSVPLSEDFTDGSWTQTDLALSEFGVLEGHNELYIRIGDNINKLQFATSATTATTAGSDTQIQFNQGGSFGANSGLTYDYNTNVFSTEAKIGTKTLTLTNGIGIATGATSNLYNNSLSGASKISLFSNGDLSDIGGDDYSFVAGYADFSSGDQSLISTSPNQIDLTIIDTTLQAGSDIKLEVGGAEIKYVSNSGKTESGLTLLSGVTELSYNEPTTGSSIFHKLDLKSSEVQLAYNGGPSNENSFLLFNSNGINLRHDTGGFSPTGIYINDTDQISMNLDNTGITQSFNVTRQESPSVYVKKFEVTTDGNVTINSEYTFPNTDGSTGQVLQTNGAGTVSWENPYIGGLFSQTGDSTTVSATTTETSIVGNGVGTLTVPANGFQVGDSFHAKIGGYISNNNNAELTIRLKSGTGTTLTTLGPIVLPSMTNQFWELETDFTVRSTGSTANIQTNGQFVYIRNFLNNYNGYGFNTTGTFDTTVDNTLDITVEWDTNNASNAIMSDLFYLKKVY